MHSILLPLRLSPALAGLALLLPALLISQPAAAAKVSERAKQKKQVEAQRAELQQKLTALKREIEHTETAKGQAADALAESESAISNADRELHDLQLEQQQETAKLDELTHQQENLAKAIDGQQRQLTHILRRQYETGNEDRIKLLLSGDDPNRINRELQMLGYVSQAQAKLITSLRTNLQAVEVNKVDTQDAKDELDEIEQEQKQQRAVLERQKAQHAALLAKLSSKLASQRKEAGTVEQNEQRLGSLVDKLAKLIEEQQKAEAAAAEKRHREELERARAVAAAKATAARETAVKPGQNGDNSNQNAASSYGKVELTPLAKAEEGVYPRDFEALRGQLRLPLRGELVAKFGSKHGDGPTWKGLFIQAPEGTEVKAVAAGRVVFAEYLRGFGNLLIIDHGNQYMTIYGNNQTVLKHAGDAVKTGEVIAEAGSSGGIEQSGLYFEMRHQGRAFDPLTWVAVK